jgi:hypothetical protein
MPSSMARPARRSSTHSVVRPRTRRGSSWMWPPSTPPARRQSRPTSAEKLWPLVTSAEVTAVMTLPHPSDAMIGGTRTGSAAGRRWWLWPTTPPDLSPAGEVHAQNTSRRRSRPLPVSRGQAKHLLKDCATMKGYICDTLGQQGKAQKPALKADDPTGGT